jgi:hypothetical protein
VWSVRRRQRPPNVNANSECTAREAGGHRNARSKECSALAESALKAVKQGTACDAAQAGRLGDVHFSTDIKGSSTASRRHIR